MTVSDPVAVAVKGDEEIAMSTGVSSTTTTTIQADGSTKVTVEETQPDGSKQIKTTVYPAGTPAPAGTTTNLPPAAASAARAAAPAPVTAHLGRGPCNFCCPFCNFTGPTYVKEKFGMCGIIALVVLLVCFWPLFFLPLIMPGCKDKEHICSNCHRKVGESEANCDTCCNN